MSWCREEDKQQTENPFDGPAFLINPMIQVYIDPDLAFEIANILLASPTTNGAIVAFGKKLRQLVQ